MNKYDAGLAEVLITAQLSLRPPSPRSRSVEAMALARIARSMEDGRSAVFDAICDMALVLCNSGSSGISVLNETPSTGFTWEALSGVLSPYQYGQAPRHDSPCGVAVDLGCTQLFAHPERHFGWIRAAGITIVEALTVPLFAEGRVPYGALWVLKHDTGDAFTRAQADIMELLAGHVSAALQLQGQRARYSPRRTGQEPAQIA